MQNCDDNEYSPQVNPQVHFKLDETSSSFSVQCNELGFEEPHVKALCDISRSTKLHKAGYIGQKGIGFKVQDPNHAFAPTRARARTQLR